MKKLVLGFIVIIVMSTVIGCGDTTENSGHVEASLPEGYTLISTSDIEKNTLYEVKHNETGCHYTLLRNHGGNFGAFTQMFVATGRDTTPYCNN